MLFLFHLGGNNKKIFSSLFHSRDKPRNSTAGSAYRFYMGSSTAGKNVTEHSAMQMTAVYSCVRILSEAVAGLPLHLYKYTDTGSAKATNHPLYALLHDGPNPEMTSFMFLETLMTHLLLWGNAYAQIIRNGKGEVVVIYPLMPDRMTVDRDENGMLYYEYQTNSGDAPVNKQSTVRLAPTDVLHIAGLGFDGLGAAGEFLGNAKAVSLLANGKWLGKSCSFAKTVGTVAKASGAITFVMGGFDTLALGSKILFGDNWFSDFNAALHESSIYNVAQTTIASVAVFTGGMNSGFNKAANSAGVKPSCFVAGTLVMAVAGMVAIETIKSGDKVISTDPETMETSPKTVLETYIREVTTLVHLTVNGEEIVTTVDHPFYVKNQGFIKAGELIVGDELLDVNGNVLLVENFDVELTDEPVKVYNFKVEDFHTYFVGNCKIWVHNNDCAKKVESGEIELETKKQKGNYGEMKMDEHYDSKGFEKMHNGVESLDDKIHHGIDGVYKNKDPNGDPKFIIAEAKYGSSQLGNTKKSGPQMGDKWIKNNIGKIVDDPDDIIEGLATGDTVKELFRVNVSNDNGLVNVTTSVKSLK